MSTPVSASAPCPSCGASEVTGNFCSVCGTALGPRTCRSCSASLSPVARFCHRCGEPAAGVIRRKSEHAAWIVAGAACIAVAAGVIWFVLRDKPAPVTPDMANVGSTGANLPAGRAPDISQLTPQQRFDRLFERVTRAADAGDTAQVAQFTPMALGSYTMLDTITIDDRFHAAVLRLNVGDYPGALALADTIQQAVPGHLFAPLIRANVASAKNDQAALLRSYRDFLASYPVEIAKNRPEYQDHKPIVDEFKSQADSAVNGKR